MAGLDPIFRPQSVAVIGASRNRDSIGFALLHNLVMNEFQGALFPVNPHAASIHSLKAYPSILEVPDPVDLAVIAVPKTLVPGVLAECVEKGVGGIVVITAGFSETGADGRSAEAALRETVRKAGIRMVGPNCMGVINTEEEVSLNATFAPTPAQPGSIGFVSQSGALGVAILNAAADLGIGLTQFVSMGNKADVSGNDLIEYWENDPATRVIAMYLESFGNPRRFTQIAKRVGRSKPILVVKSGRTAQGARAASSHTGALAGADVTVSAFLEQCGVLRANSIEDLFDIALALDRCPLPDGRRVAILTNAGGPGIMATDACVNLGLDIAELTEQTRRELAAFLPAEASLLNPVDMIASATPEQYGRALRVLAQDPGVDLVMVINVTPLLTDPVDVMPEIVAACRAVEKPLVAVMMATEDFFERIRREPETPPVYRFPESAARALSALGRYADWCRKPIEEPAVFEVDDAAVERIVAEAEGFLPPDQAFRILEAYGIPTVDWLLVADRARVAEAAARLGFPVALKAVGTDIVHKSDVGAVRLGLADADQVAVALAETEDSLREHGVAAESWLLQSMASGGHEVIFGISTDPRFGPLLMFGLGGKYVEVVRDVTFGVTPLSPGEADDMLHAIRGFRLLEGVRGEPPADLSRLRDVLLRLAQLAERHPRIRELDINPFLTAPEGEASVALDVRVRVGDAQGAHHG
ncbi:MAG: acetate--CoA ligase family protein [Thermoanaerobaculia bacterium]